MASELPKHLHNHVLCLLCEDEKDELRSRIGDLQAVVFDHQPDMCDLEKKELANKVELLEAEISVLKALGIAQTMTDKTAALLKEAPHRGAFVAVSALHTIFANINFMGDVYYSADRWLLDRGPDGVEYTSPELLDLCMQAISNAILDL